MSRDPQGRIAPSYALANADAPAATPTTPAKPQASETIARRAGAMVDEIDFPGFVAQLVHGTFDAIVDASIRQMESYADLVSACAKTVDEFTEANVSINQARDWLATRYPGDVALLLPDGADRHEPQVAPRAENLQPAWLSDYGADGEELTTELLEQRVVPQVRRNIGAERHQLLSTMVLMGLNRVAVRDGSISAKVMFRAAARDAAGVQYATSSDPKSVNNWGERGSQSYSGQSSTMVSTLAVNAQNESSVRADLFGEVKLNFVSETMPLDKLVDPVKASLVQRHAPALRAATPAAPTAPAATATTATGGV
ncbi:hypothetical protein FW784_08160 [Lysobacter lacus]|uniref:Uncharacterized protein n=2 Tax=Cognatilysobacter lacus TaxID=1643323 RepID=A0A5D8Z5C3_9GAMM|nr:hypothetical protein FW784_08160 [Lysobacter lacus]